MSNVQKYTGDALTKEQFDEVVQTGSIASLSMSQRTSYLWWFAVKLDLNPLTQPFNLLAQKETGKLIVYANRSCSDQLRQRDKLKDRILYQGPLMLGTTVRPDVYMVTVELEDPTGRQGIGIGCTGIDGLTDEALSNAIMKTHTKALRRGTLSFCGLAFPDETEIGSIGEPIGPNPNAPPASQIVDATLSNGGEPTSTAPTVAKPKVLELKPARSAAKPPASV